MFYLHALFYFSLQNKTNEASASDCFTLGTALVCGIIVKYPSLFFRKKNADLLADALEFMYTPWPDNSNKYALRSGLVDLLGDNIFVAPSHKVADVQSQVAPVYMYEFAHRAKSSLEVRAEWMGVVHGENIPFDFGAPFLPKFSDVVTMGTALQVVFALIVYLIY